MELWMIGSKSALLAYVIAASFFLTAKTTAWEVLAYLSCMIAIFLVPIFKKARPRMLLTVLTAALVVWFAYQLNPMFLLLLPVSLCEFVHYAAGKTVYGLGLLALSLILVPHEQLPLYVLVSVLVYLLCAGLRLYTGKLSRMEDRQEAMREDLQRLTRSLHESNEYIRQSAYTIKLEERNRLSQQIHDEVGHAMAGALIQMEASRRVLASNPGLSAELLGNAIAISKEGLERIRLTLKNMKPKSEELGINRLRLFVDELAAKHAIAASVVHSGDIDLITPMQWNIIQLNATEAVTNSLKYSAATAISIEISLLNRFVKAVVADNGRGAEKVIKGLGIVGMEERAASAGGNVIVDGSKGFTVTTLLPI